MIILTNQLTVPVFIDIVNAVSQRNKNVVLFTGKIEKANVEILKEVKVVKSFQYRRNTLFTRFLTWVLFSLHFITYVSLTRKIKHIVVVTNPPILPIIISGIAKLRRIPYSILVYDLYPEALFQVGISNEKSRIVSFWKKLNPFVFNGAKEVITLSDSMKEALSIYMDKPERVRIIHNWTQVEYIKPIEKSINPFVIKHGLLDKFVVMYSGNMGLTHDLESLMEAAELLKESTQIMFILIGDGAKRKHLVSKKESRKIENVIFLPYQNSADFPTAIAAADVGIITLGLGAEGISVPSKTYSNMGAGLCILAIAPKASELSRLIEAHKCGFICEPGNPKEIASFLLKISSDTLLLEKYKNSAKEASFLYTSENAKLYSQLFSQNA